MEEPVGLKAHAAALRTASATWPRRPEVPGRPDPELAGLAEELDRILEHHAVNEGLRMPAPAHFHDEARHRQRIARPPIARTGHADPIRSESLDDVGRALWRHFGLRVERQSRPVPACENLFDGVLFGVIDHHAAGHELRVPLEHVDRHLRALQLVFEMRGVDQNQLLVGEGQLDLFGERRHFVAGNAVHPDLADAEHGRPVEELRNSRQHIAGKLAIVGLLGVHRQPRSSAARPYCAARFGSNSVSCRK